MAHVPPPSPPMLPGVLGAAKKTRRTVRAKKGSAPPTTPPKPRGFWTNGIAALSQRLWCPTQDDLHESDWPSWVGSTKTMTQKSWFTALLWKNIHQKICGTSYTLPQVIDPVSDEKPPSPPEKKQKTDSNVKEKAPAGKTRRFRCYPNKEQKKTIDGWIKAMDYTYNWALELTQEAHAKFEAAVKAQEKADATAGVKKSKKRKREKSTYLGKKELRALIVNNDVHENSSTKWLLNTPYEVRDAAMIELLDAYKSNQAKRRKNPNHTWTIHPRERNRRQATLMIRGKCYKDGRFYPSFFGKKRLSSSGQLPYRVNYDCKLTRTRIGQYYLSIPMPLETAQDSGSRVPNRVVALDPGVRTFHTAYDPSGFVWKVGNKDIGHIYRICVRMDKLQSRIDSDKTIRHKKRYRMRRAYRKMQWRVRNLVDECHKKLVKFLCSNYSVVLLPSFETQQMVIRKQRKISSQTARNLMTWSHYRFKQRLLFKKQEYPSCNVIICNEAYTTKTCGRCGYINDGVGKKKIFRCPSCRITLDRDVNGARNILLKNSSLFGFKAT